MPQKHSVSFSGMWRMSTCPHHHGWVIPWQTAHMAFWRKKYMDSGQHRRKPELVRISKSSFYSHTHFHLLSHCIGFMWQCFGSRRLQVWLVWIGQDLPHLKSKPVPTSSKGDRLLPTAEPIGDAGGTSAITHLRKGKIHSAAVVRERNEKMWEKTLQTPRLGKKEGEEVL